MSTFLRATAVILLSPLWVPLVVGAIALVCGLAALFAFLCVAFFCVLLAGAAVIDAVYA